MPYRSDLLRTVNIALHHLHLRQAYWLISHLDCPVESCFKVFIHKGGVCPLLQQHLGVLRPVVESCPVECRHPLQNHSQRGRDEHRLSGRKVEYTLSPQARRHQQMRWLLSVHLFLESFIQLPGFLLDVRQTGVKDTIGNKINEIHVLVGTPLW